MRFDRTPGMQSALLPMAATGFRTQWTDRNSEHGFSTSTRWTVTSAREHTRNPVAGRFQL